MSYTYLPDGDTKVKDLLADLAQMNPGLINGFVLIGVLIDGSPVVAHNACCLTHFIEALSADLAANAAYAELSAKCDRESYL